VTARKRKRGGGVLGQRAAKLGQPGPTTRARGRKKKADGLGVLAGRKRCWASGEKREGEGGEEDLFFLNFFSNSFFKHSNFNQTEIHAFES
jgi:hypothetical protein